MSTDRNVVLGRHPWRYTCPRGHHSLEVTAPNNPSRRYVCKMCQRNRNDTTHYSADDLIDKRERERTDDGSWNGL